MDGAHPAPSAPYQRHKFGMAATWPSNPKAGTGAGALTKSLRLKPPLLRVEAKGLDILDIDAAAFPLPTIAPEIERIRQTVLHGPGIFLLRGLPVSQWTVKQAAIAFWGLGAHMGDPCSQNGKGHVLGHVKNLGLDYAAAATRGIKQRPACLTTRTQATSLACSA